MRRLNLKATSENILTEIKSHTLYDFHGLTESANYDEKTENYVKEHFKFSFEGTRETQKNIANIFLKTLKSMQEEYMLAMNLETPLFYIEKARSKSAPNNTVVIELDIENVKGSFATIVKYAGQHMNQYNANILYVRANTEAKAWTSLYDRKITSDQKTPFIWCNERNANKWLNKVKRARHLAGDCLTTKGSVTKETQSKLRNIMAM